MRGTSDKKNSRRKHRLYVDVTFSSPVTMRDAAKGLDLIMQKVNFDRDPVWAYDLAPRVDKIVVVERRQ